jgi:hypothetical protein
MQKTHHVSSGVDPWPFVIGKEWLILTSYSNHQHRAETDRNVRWIKGMDEFQRNTSQSLEEGDNLKYIALRWLVPVLPELSGGQGLWISVNLLYPGDCHAIFDWKYISAAALFQLVHRPTSSGCHRTCIRISKDTRWMNLSRSTSM